MRLVKIFWRTWTHWTGWDINRTTQTNTFVIVVADVDDNDICKSESTNKSGKRRFQEKWESGDTLLFGQMCLHTMFLVIIQVAIWPTAALVQVVNWKSTESYHHHRAWLRVLVDILSFKWTSKRHFTGNGRILKVLRTSKRPRLLSRSGKGFGGFENFKKAKIVVWVWEGFWGVVCWGGVPSVSAITLPPTHNTLDWKHYNTICVRH